MSLLRRSCPAPALLMACSLFGAAAHASAAGLADPLPGRLFHTPAERAALDRGTERGEHPVHRAARPPALAPENSRTLSGFVLRSDGRNSYWLEAPQRPAAEPLSR